jgi:kynureninase
VTVRTPAFESVHRALDAHGIVCDYRPDAGIRLGPHFFTSDDELVATVEAITEIVETGAYEQEAPTASRF